MPKALNLTDMLWQRNGASGQERAQDAGDAQGPARAARRPRADFLPPQPDPAAHGADKGGAVKSFRERVKESQDRLARREHTFFKQPGRPDAPEAEAAKARAARTEAADRDAQAGSDARSRGLSRATARKADRSEGPDTPAKLDRTDTARGEPGTEAQAAGASRTIRDRSAAPDRETQGARSDGTAEEAATLRPGSLRPEAEGGQAGADGDTAATDQDALATRLAELGLEATPEQLQDPAFLAAMLWQIDGIPMGLPLFPETAPADAPADILPLAATLTMPQAGSEAALDVIPAGTRASATLDGYGSEAAPLAGLVADPVDDPAAAPAPAPAAGSAQAVVSGAGNAVPAGTDLADVLPDAAGDDAPPAAGAFAWTAVAEAEREEIAALVRDRLAGIAADPALRLGSEAARATTTGIPDAVQMARAGADFPAEAVASDADPVLADPDRLRVLQNAGLEDALSRENAWLALERDLEAGAGTEDGEENRAEAKAMPDALARRTSRDDSQDSPPDLFGRGNADARPEAFGARESAGAQKEAAATPFHSALETARASEARPAQAKAPVPHAHAPMEASVLAQLARKLSALGPRSAEEIRIQLEPEHLGKVRIAIEMRGEGLTARISVENDAVRQMVDQNLGALKESLENQGVKIQGMEVSVEQRHASLFNPDGSNAREFFRRRGGEPAASDAAGNGGAEGEAEPDTGRRLGYNTMEFIA